VGIFVASVLSAGSHVISYCVACR